MDLRPTEEQEQLISTFEALYAKESSPDRVRDAEPLGFDEVLWHLLVEQGAVMMAVDEDRGGWGASMLDLALVAEQHGRALGSAPLIDAQVAARLLARMDGQAEPALEAILAGAQLGTLALHPTQAATAKLVPGGAVADMVIISHRGDLVLMRPKNRVVPENLGAMPLADLIVEDPIVLLKGDRAQSCFEEARTEWLLLTAHALVGIAVRALELGVDYVKERKAFGQTIGSFQAVAHPLADSAAAIDGAQLLSREAAWAVDCEPERAAELAAMSFAFAAEAARDVTARALHFHGGYGFMMEYDIQLYYRRARAWAQVGLDPARAYRRAADYRYGRVGAQ